VSDQAQATEEEDGQGQLREGHRGRW
jgi:hypothetical protein